ncbi:MAG: HAMP domain-containing histidine kinase [Chloroflexi bacterium]|nr:HAMP domain-containing histidine kinase [Chloroflexota bacterium]
MKRFRFSPPLRLMLLYAVISTAWILFGDLALAALARDTQQLTQMQTAKGIFFVVVTSLLFYGLADHEWRAMKNQNDELETLKADLEQRVARRTAELEAANIQLRELDVMKSALIENLSHDLRGPISSLSLRLELMERVGPERQGEYLAGLQEQVSLLRELVEDVMDMSRLQDSRGRLEFSPVDLNAVTQEVVNIYRPIAQASGLEMEFQSQADVPPVLGRRNHLARMLSNLLANAVKYTHSGQVRVRVVFDAARQRVLVLVKDSGIGIEPAEAGQLFDRFYRGAKAREMGIPGTGLGLSIVKEIVDLHQGEIMVDSQPGQGSVFRVWLPPANGPAAK